jgi:hypothetical protein
MKHSIPLAALIAMLSLSACDKPTVIVVPPADGAPSN